MDGMFICLCCVTGSVCKEVHTGQNVCLFVLCDCARKYIMDIVQGGT